MRKREFELQSKGDLQIIAWISFSMGALLEKYKRLDEENDLKALNICDISDLDSASELFISIENGFQQTNTPLPELVRNTDDINLYNFYCKLCLKFNYLSLATTIEGSWAELREIKLTIKYMKELRRVDNIGLDKIDKLAKFFYRAGYSARDEYIFRDQEEYI